MKHRPTDNAAHYRSVSELPPESS